MMNILLLGGGGREHALAWKLKQSTHCGTLYCAPGNPGTAQLGINLPELDPANGPAVGEFVQNQNIGLVVVGPEAPLVAGVADYLRGPDGPGNVQVIGPGKAGARLEGSKVYSKEFMLRNGIPTARAKAFGVAELEAALTYVRQHALPVVIKADGLAQGKGVVVAQTTAEAEEAVRQMLEGQQFGEASAQVLVEEFLSGKELSVFVLTGGSGYVVLPTAQDYKRVGESDSGPNTGGMGAVSPAPVADEPFMQRIRREIIEPTLIGLSNEKIPYEGFIFFGLIRVAEDPYVIEYNVRLGDPETQAILPRVNSDLLELFAAMPHKRLAYTTIYLDEFSTCAVVLAAEGYPGPYATGHPISGIAEAEKLPGVHVFQAGTAAGASPDELLTNGGRVLTVVAHGRTAAEAAAQAHAAADLIEWNGVFRRRDVGR